MRVWDAAGGNTLNVLRGHELEVTSAVFSPDGRHIVSGSADQTVRIWNDEGRAGLAVVREDESFVFSVEYSSDGQYIVSRSVDKVLRVWDAKSGRCLEVIRGEAGLATIDVIVGGENQFPFGASADGLETVIKDATTAKPVAWFPATLWAFAPNPNEREWSGSVRASNHLYILRLEGGAPTKP